MRAVHFGAGNIGRGFIGLILNQAGYELVFADVNSELIDSLNNAKTYEVHEVGVAARTFKVGIAGAINSSTQAEQLSQEISDADIVTCAVGPSILKFIAPSILAGLTRRTRPEPLIVMACENAVNATNQLKSEIQTLAGPSWPDIEAKAVFANTAVDRIVPVQAPDSGLDVTVEDFCEWTIESGPFNGDIPPIGGAHFVPILNRILSGNFLLSIPGTRRLHILASMQELTSFLKPFQHQMCTRMLRPYSWKPLSCSCKNMGSTQPIKRRIETEF